MPEPELSDWYEIRLLFKADEQEAEDYLDLVCDSVWGTLRAVDSLIDIQPAVSMERLPIEDWQFDD